MKNNNIKRFLIAFLIFTVPLILLFVIELYVLPIDFFTFRVWEALRVKEVNQPDLPGPFYPNIKIQTWEVGDLAPHTRDAICKNVFWQTDAYGYRATPGNKEVEVLIIGDSNAAGSTQSQDETLAAVLEKKLRQGVYSLAPASINDFFSALRFKKHLPKIVLLERIERHLSWEGLPQVDYEKLHAFEKYNPGKNAQNTMHLDSWFNAKVKYPFYTSLDRLWSSNMWNNLKSRMGLVNKPAYFNNQSTYFLQGELANTQRTEEEINTVVKILEEYNRIFKEMHIRFIFMPIPNKETIYFDLLPSKKKPDFLRRLFPKLKEKGIEVIDLEPALDSCYTKKILTYDKDDAHWNAAGVRVAAKLINW
jgi:alginate O-acetyltransferase complex protein AlgJ